MSASGTKLPLENACPLWAKPDICELLFDQPCLGGYFRTAPITVSGCISPEKSQEGRRWAETGGQKCMINSLPTRQYG